MQPFRPEISARLAELAPLLLDELEDMTDRMLEVLLRSEPAYRDLLVPEEELRASTRRNLAQGLQTLISGWTDHQDGVRDAARAVGRRRAAQGVPLEAVLRAYRLGGQVTWEALLSVSQRSSHRHDVLLLEVAGSVWRTNDADCAAVAEG